MAKKQAITGTYENEADKQVLAAVAAAEAAGDDPFGDNEFDAAPATAATPAADDELAEDAADAEIEVSGDEEDEDKTETEPTQQVAAEEKPGVAAEPAAQATESAAQYEVRTTIELTDAKKALRDQKRAAFEKYDVGDLSLSEWMTEQERIDTQMEVLIEEGALARANEQITQREQAAAIASIITLGKTEKTINYETDPTAAAEFNAALHMAAKNPKNAGLPFAEVAKVAHGLVLHMRGVTPAAKAATPKAEDNIPAPRVPGKGPTTLSRVPAASVPNTNGGISEQLGRLDGLDFQEAIARMPKAQRDAYLDS